MRWKRIAVVMAVLAVALFCTWLEHPHFVAQREQEKAKEESFRIGRNEEEGYWYRGTVMNELALYIYYYLDLNKDADPQLGNAVSDSIVLSTFYPSFTDNYFIRVNNDLSVWKAFDYGNGRSDSPVLVAAVSKQPVLGDKYRYILMYSSSARTERFSTREEFEKLVPWFREGVDVGEAAEKARLARAVAPGDGR